VGYSSRYHAASLAAVFLALAVGILIGVGFGSDIVSGTAEDLEQSLEADLSEAQAEIDDLRSQLETERDFEEAVAPAVVGDRLRGLEIAVVALGDLDEALAANVRAALEPSGATLQQIAVVNEPPGAAAAEVMRERDGRSRSRAEALTLAGERAGKTLLEGGDRFDELRDTLFGRYSGEPGGIDAVVVVRQRPEEMSAREAADTDRIEEGLMDGMRSASANPPPIVGVERTDTDPSSIEFFADRGAATVDNLDQVPGQVSIVYALDGAEGNFGVKETADALLPDLLVPPTLDFGAASRG
jgi:hypothetical protein